MDNSAFELIYKKYYKELYLYVYSLCRHQHLAEEIVSDTFYKAFSTVDTVMEKNGYLKFWLYRVSKNIWIDYIRKNKEWLTDDHLLNIKSKEDTVQQIIQDEKKATLYKSICQLKPSYKEIIILYYYCEFSLKEIAKSLN